MSLEELLISFYQKYYNRYKLPSEFRILFRFTKRNFDKVLEEFNDISRKFKYKTKHLKDYSFCISPSYVWLNSNNVINVMNDCLMVKPYLCDNTIKKLYLRDFRFIYNREQPFKFLMEYSNDIHSKYKDRIKFKKTEDMKENDEIIKYIEFNYDKTLDERMDLGYLRYGW